MRTRTTILEEEMDKFWKEVKKVTKNRTRDILLRPYVPEYDGISWK